MTSGLRPIAYALGDAQDHGVTWRTDGAGKVTFRGPASAEPIVRELISRKAEVLEMLRPRACLDCGALCGSAARCAWCATQRVYAPRDECGSENSERNNA
jgi:hypothetical protein